MQAITRYTILSGVAVGGLVIVAGGLIALGGLSVMGACFEVHDKLFPGR